MSVGGEAGEKLNRYFEPQLLWYDQLFGLPVAQKALTSVQRAGAIELTDLYLIGHVVSDRGETVTPKAKDTGDP